MDRSYFVYILASKSRRLYIGVTNDLERRAYEHKNKLVKGFTEKYNIDRVVYFEQTGDVMAAIEREKQLKGWRRERKIALIEAMNPTWDDLSEQWKRLPHTYCHSEREARRICFSKIRGQKQILRSPQDDIPELVTFIPTFHFQ